MGVPDGAHTHSHGGGSGLGPVVLVIFAVALLGPAVAAAVAELLPIVLIVAAAIGGTVLAGGAALVAVRVHRWRVAGTTQMSFPAPPWRPRESRQEIGQAPPAIDHHYVRFHGLAAEDVAGIIDRQNGQGHG